MELEALIGLAALPVVIPALTEHIKQFFRAVQDRRVGADETATPWPLVADTVGILYSVGAWYSGWMPQDKVDSGHVGGYTSLECLAHSTCYWKLPLK